MSGSFFLCGDISIFVETGGLWLLFSKDDFVRFRQVLKRLRMVV